MQFESLNSVTLHFRHKPAVDGSPTLVFINSLGTDFRIWDGVIRELPGNTGALTYDKRGHGLSDEGDQPVSIGAHGDDLIALMEAQGLQKAVLCGLSVGGMIALDVYQKRPERVEALALFDTAPKIGEVSAWQDRIDTVRSSGMTAIADATMTRWFSKTFCDTEKSALSAYRNMLCRTSAQGYIGTCEAIRDGDYSNVAMTVSVPTLCAVGSDDLATPPASVEAMAKSITGAMFQKIDGVGHLPCVEHPSAVAQLLKTFLASELDAGRGPDPDDKFEVGMNIRQRVLGKHHVERANQNLTAFDAPFQRLITEAAWGHVWARPTWTLRERSIVTIALLAALGYDEEVAMHARSSANTGASRDDLSEAMLHVAIYAGVPAANSAIKIIKHTFAEESEKEKNQ